MRTINRLVILESVPVANDCLRLSPQAAPPPRPCLIAGVRHQTKRGQGFQQRPSRLEKFSIHHRPYPYRCYTAHPRCCEHSPAVLFGLTYRLQNSKDHPTHARPARTKDAGTEYALTPSHHQPDSISRVFPSPRLFRQSTSSHPFGLIRH